VIYPVCGLQFARQHPLSSPEQLIELPLLRLDGLDPAWTGWDSWLSNWNLNVADARFRRFNNYVVALQAAEENQGVALGWHSMVEPLIQRGKLVRFGDMEIRAPGSFYLSWDVNRPLTRQADLLRQWLLKVSVGSNSLCAVKRRVFSVGANPTRQLSLQPVVIGAVVEVTKRPKPPV